MGEQTVLDMLDELEAVEMLEYQNQLWLEKDNRRRNIAKRELIGNIKRRINMIKCQKLFYQWKILGEDFTHLRDIVQNDCPLTEKDVAQFKDDVCNFQNTLELLKNQTLEAIKENNKKWQKRNGRNER